MGSRNLSLSTLIIHLLAIALILHATPSVTAHSVKYDELYSGERLEVVDTSKDDIEVLGAWGKNVLTVLIVPGEDERYTRWAGRAVDWWEEAIETFTSLYGYEHLSRLDLVKLVRGVNGTSGDIVIEYVSNLEGRICGLAYPYVIDGEIRRAIVRISLTCIGGREEYAMVAILHELGHALGLGHTENSNDLMYEYLIPGSRPSTLNLYALAVAYAWIEAGYFKRPPESVSLPSRIKYMQLLNELGEPVKFRIRIFLKLGDEERLNQTIILTAGESVTFRVNSLLEGGRTGWERYVFTGWLFRESGQIASENVSLSVKPTDHTDFIAQYDVEYRVVIDNPSGVSLDVWAKRGSKMTVDADEVVYLSDVERLVFVEWRGTLNSTQRVFEFQVDSPIRLSAIYTREFHVEVSSEFGEPVGGGWWSEGTIVNITVIPHTIYIDENTRLALRGFNGTLSTNTAHLTINLTGPLSLTAVWATQHLVILRGAGGEFEEAFWVDEGSTITASAPEVIDWQNRTKAVFAGWMDEALDRKSEKSLKITGPLLLVALYERYFLVEVESAAPVVSQASWVRRGEFYEVEVPDVVVLREGRRMVYLGSSHGVGRQLRIQVSGPEVVVLFWREEAKITVYYPQDGISRSFWAPLGTILRIDAPPLIPVSESEALEFTEWAGDIKSKSRSLTLEVYGSLNLRPEFRTLHRVLLTTLPSLPTIEITLRDQSGNLYRVSNLKDVAWLPRGPIEILSVEWMGLDLKSENWLNITGPGRYTIKLPVKSLDVRLADVFGLPAPYYTITALRENNVAESHSVSGPDGSARLGAVSPAASKLRARWMFFESSADLSLEGLELVVPVSFYTLLLAFAAIIITSSAMAYKRFSA